MSSGRHHIWATGDGRQRQHDARCTSGVADNRDAVIGISLEIRFRSLDVEWNGTVAASSEAHVAVGIDKTWQSEPPGKLLRPSNWLVSPSVLGQPGVLNSHAVW